ncbi:MAG: translation initiation factor IF-2 [Roseovarius sp.]|nr:translation initiation factor IF-2 [Roseovarius sp.]MCY4206682.1 translation initiation factor IF-2 [Roseovarius sp.]MCY4292504.1 translation initiation factor IF-2 [Roseovarius sp.]MCY4315458.1 translation initiation factor IF-2 [Roseovarius sp.]
MSNRDGKKTIEIRGGAQAGGASQKFRPGGASNVLVEKKRKIATKPRKGLARRLPADKKLAEPEADKASVKRDDFDAETMRKIEALKIAKQVDAKEAEERKRKEDEIAEKRRREAEAEKLRAERLEVEKLEAERKRLEEEARLKSEGEAAREKARQAKQKAKETGSGPGMETPPASKDKEQGSARPGKSGQRKSAAGRNEDSRVRGKARDENRRRRGKLTVNQALEGEREKSLAAIKRKQKREREKSQLKNEVREKIVRDVQLPEMIMVGELANRMAERVADVVKALMQNGMMVTQNQSIDADTAELIAGEFGHRVQRVSDADVEDVIDTIEDKEADLRHRPPVITIMGHVDHGKTSLLDAIRKTKVVDGEAGGITQHIGAYQVVSREGAVLTFLDTPGHAAFTSMRARGAQVTDIVILVVAADDSVMPQTIEAINHARAAGVPLIVAINKCDKSEANPDNVRSELLRHEVIVEAMSGEVQDVEVSATTGEGLGNLLEAIAIQAELLELKANPTRPAEGAVIEAQLDVGRGPVATVLVQRGTLRKGDTFVVGEQFGKVRALINDRGEKVEEAGPSVPVKVLGLNGTPEAGDVLNVVATDAQAREISEYRAQLAKEKRIVSGGGTTLDQLLAQAKENENRKELPIVVKSDVQGSAEAIKQSMEKIGNDEVCVRILHSGVGAITESDIGLAEASSAPVLGFNVRANASARNSAHQKGVEIRYYSVIYDLVDDVRAAASGLLSSEYRENYIGYARIKEVFKVSGVGKVAGCLVTEGIARRSAFVRLLRDDVVVHEGTLKTLKRFKDEVQEVQSGQECGMAFENYDDIRQNDNIEIYERLEIERKLD